MRILIVETVWMGKESYKLFDISLLTAFSILPTLHARQLAAITPKEHNVTVINERYTRLEYNAGYDLVAIDFVTSTAPHAYDIADTFRSKGIPVVLCGMHASAIPTEAKDHSDSVIIGRAEQIWATVLKDAAKKNIQPYYTAAAYDESTCLPSTSISLPGFVMTGAIEATRGCPYRCSFCPETTFSKDTGYYKRPIDEVIAEIKALPQKLFTFYDASLTIDPQYTKELFKKMKGLHKRFFCNGNADVLAADLELVRLSKQSGCIGWLIGFESLSQHTLESVGKKTNNVNDYHTAINHIHDNHMVVIGCFIFGFDTDTPTVFTDTLQVLKKLDIDIMDFCVLTPFPGTSIYNQLDKEGRIQSKDWGSYNLKTVVFQPKQMTPEQLLKGVQLMYMTTYTPLEAFKRIAKSLRLGLYPFFAVLMRTLVATMNSRRLFSKKTD